MKNNRLETILGEGTTLSGELVSDGIIRMDGRFSGNIIGSSIIIGKTAVVKADIKCSELVIYGKVHGNVEAKHRVEILPGGELIGDMKTKGLSVSEGAYFLGKCEMNPEAPEG